jgi:hypothetical protein
VTVDRDAVLAAVDLRALADELLGPRRGPPSSAHWRCPSPHHAQTGRTPPVSIFDTATGGQRWRCHGCGAGGTAIDLLVVARGLSVGDSFRALAARSPLQGPPRREFHRPAPAIDLCDLSRYVDQCADRLWRPSGRPVLTWLLQERGLPAAVLRANRIGADLGPRRQPRPDGIPRVGPAVVLPATEGGRDRYVQLRLLRPWPDGPRYLGPTSSALPNPRLARFKPAIPATLSGVVVCEGAIDALSAASAGAFSVAVLGTSVCDDRLAERIAALGHHPVVLAFDADPAGRRAANTMETALRDRNVEVVHLELPAGYSDLNDWHRIAGSTWQEQLARRLPAAPRPAPAPCVGLA